MAINIFKIKKLKIGSLAIPIVLLAAFLRLENLRYMEFKADEAVNSFLAHDLVYKGIFPLTGDVSSLGAYNPPAFVYLLTIPFIFSKNPVVASGFVALLNILAVCLCFLFCSKFFNRRIALVACAFFAVNPWVVLYSRKIWASDLLPLFILIFFYSLYEIVINEKQKYILLAFFSFAIFTQLHFSTLYFLPLWISIFIIFRPRIKLKYFLFGVSIPAFLYLPYILFELQNNFYNLKVFHTFLKMPFKCRAESLVMPFKLATAYDFLCSFNFSAINIFQMTFLGVAVIYLIYNLKDRKYSMLFFWFIVPILFLTISKKFSPNHYFIALFPVQFIMLGILWDRFYCLTRRNYYAIVLILLLLLPQALCSLEFFSKTIREKRNIYWMGYGPPLKYRSEEIRLTLNKGYQDIEEIHRRVSKGNSIFKYDFLATQYIAKHIDSIY